MGRRFSAFVVAALIAAAPRAAHAFSTSRLEYERGPGTEACPEEPVVRAKVEKRLGYDPFVDAAAKTIVVRVSRGAAGLQASVELVDPEGARQGLREFSAGAGHCDDLVSALALSISIAVDPERAESAEPDSAPELIPPPKPPEPERTAPRTLDTPPQRDQGIAAPLKQRKEREPHWLIGAGGHAALNSAPSATGGAFVFLGGRFDALSMALEGRADLPAATTVNGGAEVGTSLLLVSAVPCWHHAHLFACGLLSAGALRASGKRVVHPGDDSAFYAAAGLRLGSTFSLYEPLTLRVNLDVLDTLTRVSLEIDEQTVWEAPAFSTAAGAGLLARFP